MAPRMLNVYLASAGMLRLCALRENLPSADSRKGLEPLMCQAFGSSGPTMAEIEIVVGVEPPGSVSVMKP